MKRAKLNAVVISDTPAAETPTEDSDASVIDVDKALFGE